MGNFSRPSRIAHSKRTDKSGPASIFTDWAANKRRHKIRIVLLLFRVTQTAMGDVKRPRILSYPLVAFYRFVSEWIFGMELRPTTEVGSPLVIHHGFGLVVNPAVTIADGVTLRNGVTIGNKTPGGPVPRIGNNVEIGANAIIIGDVSVGAGAVIGAGSVVLRDVAPGVVVAGNPARIIRAGGDV